MSASANGDYLMWPISVDGSQPSNYDFSPTSITTIQGVVAAKGGCYKDVGAAQCGNGVQEGDEACDCGSASACPSIDACCATTDCVLAGGGAQCR